MNTELSSEFIQSAQMQPLNPLTFPLNGTSLIEASAGTGKTYTIVNLYLRLLLGRGCQPHGIEQILVVTFTNAATAELKERIRSRLRQAYLDFFAGHSRDAFIQSLIEQAQELDQDCQRLSLAIKQMDEAAVFTIHGFSQKALTEHAFESGALYQQQFIMDESEWLQLAVEDYWRKHIVTQSGLCLQLILKNWSGPAKLLKHIQTFIYRDVQINPSVSFAKCNDLLEQYQQQVTVGKKWWLAQGIEQQLAKAKLNGRAKLSKLTFLKEMTEFCQSSLLEPPANTLSWQEFSPEKIQKALKNGSEDISHLDFAVFERLAELQQACQNGINLWISEQSIQVVRDNLASHKSRLLMLSPDDLLQGLNRALTHKVEGKSPLAEKLASSYPVALIDEFQDTDPIQFESFKAIYANEQPNQEVKSTSSDVCWIMIGDPKQAIYGFRGADIYTYIGAKTWIDSTRQFTLATNWRSAPELVNGINQLFKSSQRGFLFEQNIPFYSVDAGKTYSPLKVNGEKVSPLHFQHVHATDGLAVKTNDAKQQLAMHSAEQIACWLNLSNQGLAEVNGNPVLAGDICVLVRDRNEASLIKQTLFNLNVDSVFLTRQSVFETQVAQDLLRLLKALSQPNEEKLLKTALISELFSFTANQLDELFNDDVRWQSLLDLRFDWSQSWKKHGVMHAINRVLQHFSIEQNMVSEYADGHRRITDLQHLMELLQQQSLILVGESQLLHWFESAILNPEPNSESQQLRVESDANLVQIVTLHASKGLEFPLVFVPFSASFRAQSQALFHNPSAQLEVDFLANDASLQQAEFERLAEDIRLFYVAVTRAVHYCYIGVWNTALGRSVKSSAFHQSALGNLLLAQSPPSEAEQNRSISDQHIQHAIQGLASKADISYQAFTDCPVSDTAYQDKQLSLKKDLTSAQLNRKVTRNWKLTSYSALSRQQVTQEHDVPVPGFDEGHQLDQQALVQIEEVEQKETTPFSFEKGANAGSFLHELLENIDFQQPDQLTEVIQQKSIKFGIDPSNHLMLNDWIRSVLSTNISKQTDSPLSLSGLAARQIKVEMEFHMPLKKVHVAAFNQIINQFEQQQTREYQFETLHGMLKGFIDLTFEFNGQFYVADYKSNYLGDTLQSYSHSMMEQAMTEHDYHLQGILYSLALHRWLKNVLPVYDYDKHVGGAYYLFLRGMDDSNPGYGVYHFKVDKTLITALDLLFSGQSLTPKTDNSLDNKNTGVEKSGQMGLW